ncbi:MAG: sulfite exporter TauE/SafE family protein [Calditrichaeota bacterium]|nr:MAG: sulfite exporter TauE/SafE family protein [Calditrichota bacterium]MBL1207624.1 sulfite exporter TauE/SafE family protein [Calditrichota bacterium]NOG47457.1 sulfite exporter TauE/SafE family protein [Calditrichota bacterium]
MDWILLLAIVFILAAYFVKGFSGFGPALIIVPSFTILYDPLTAISLSSLFDAIGGTLLLLTVLKNVNWRFVFPTAFFLAIGSYLGVSILGFVPVNLLKILIAAVVCIFIYVLISNRKFEFTFIRKSGNPFLFALATLTGMLAGLTGTGGPILIIFLKLKNRKKEFRSQAIAIFTIGAIWRLFLYEYNNFLPELNLTIFVMILFMVIGLAFGHFLQRNVNEQLFNRYVALILIIPVMTLFFEAFIK